MSRWVDADWIKDRNSFVPRNELHTVEEFMQILDEAPTADVVPITREVPVIHGEIDVKNGTVTYHPVRTNADRIRAMSDEELAQFFLRTASEFSCHPDATNEDCKKVGGWWHGCPQCWLNWLHSPAGGDGDD